MIEIHTELTRHLRELHLPSFRECYQSEADLARQESLPHEHYLLELAKRECEERTHKRTARYLRESKLPLEKSIEVFDRKRLPAKVNSLVEFLLKGSLY
jgi:DNA replication protein DnaC